MKKVLLVLISLLLLCACSNSHTTKVENGDEVVYLNDKGKAYTKQDLYDDMMLNDVTTQLTNDLIVKLGKLEGVDIDAINEKVKEEANEIVEAGQEYYINYYYGNIDNYINNMIPYSVMEELKKNYIDADLTRYEVDYEPFKAQMINLDDEEVAKKIVEDVDAGKEFLEALALNGHEDEVTTTLYTNNDDLPLEVKDYVTNSETGFSGIITVAIVSDEEAAPTYYLLNLVSKNVEDFKDEFLNVVSQDIDNDTVIINLLNKYDVNIYDQRVYDLLTAKYEVLK